MNNKFSLIVNIFNTKGLKLNKNISLIVNIFKGGIKKIIRGRIHIEQYNNIYNEVIWIPYT